MNDLIWIGNTLYPRWFVFVAIGALPMSLCLAQIVVATLCLFKKDND